MKKSIKMNFSKEGLVFSELENKIMGYLWRYEKGTARKIYSKLNRKDIALTAIVMALDRLHKKGIVNRKVGRGKGGLHYIYFPGLTKEGFGEKLSLLFAEKMISTFGPAVASNFSKEALEKLKKGKHKR